MKKRYRTLSLAFLACFSLLTYLSASASSSLRAEDSGQKPVPVAEKRADPAAEKPAEKTGEEEIFNSEETVTPHEKIKDDGLSQHIEKKSLAFNGFLNSRNSYIYKRGSMLRQMDIVDNNDILSYFQGNFILDARLTQGVKGYVNFSADYYPMGLSHPKVFQVPLAYWGIPAYFTKADVMVSEKTNAVYSINEIFTDVNINKVVYFRIGKQVLKWGTGYLWMPTDLINVEKKNILDSSQVRQGAYGLKMHIPFGTLVNIYSFVDLGNAKHASDIAGAFKLELLLKNTEMSLSTVLKNHRVPVYGYDFTTRLFLVDVHGEASVSYGDNDRRMGVIPSYIVYTPMPSDVSQLMMYSGKSFLTYRVRGQWIPKASLGFGKGFDVKDIKDRVRIDTEFFYNGAGYDRNMFDQNGLTTAYFLSQNLYKMNYYGRYYAGLFITVKQIFIEELSVSLNGIMNAGDRSSVVSGLISYSPIYDLTLNLMVNGFIGQRNREYTVMGNYLTTELSIKIVF